MTEKKREESANSPKLTVDDLKGKQSVRATFKLPQQVIDLISIIAGQLGIKQKSLFDQLVENASILDLVARDAQKHFSHYKGENQRRQKTFVMSRSSLLSLDNIARQQKIPRDILVEVSIKRLLPVIETELEKHNKRKILLEEMGAYLRQGQRLLEKTGELFGEDDSVYEMIRNQVDLAEKNAATINAKIEKGMPMEDW